jgi:hypothetical protein
MGVLKEPPKLKKLLCRVSASGCPLTPPSEPCMKAFPSHGSSLTKAPPDVEDPLPRREAGSLSTPGCQPGRLGNTELWPFCAELHGATTPGRTERLASPIICFSQLKRFHMLSCQVRPDRRGHISRVTRKLWLFRSSQCCACSACLTVGLATNRVAQDNSFSMFCIRYQKR